MSHFYASKSSQDISGIFAVLLLSNSLNNNTVRIPLVSVGSDSLNVVSLENNVAVTYAILNGSIIKVTAVECCGRVRILFVRNVVVTENIDNTVYSTAIDGKITIAASPPPVTVPPLMVTSPN